MEDDRGLTLGSLRNLKEEMLRGGITKNVLVLRKGKCLGRSTYGKKGKIVETKAV